ncbi:hypothetical protein MSAN_02301900 [Mycena sanguinolenta]|uniref:Uncharacterized protein n=1 Tax=Mycena sanguinolenta TaxID=230812 RepID=A0A8H7CG72_9AGAR|nr:hypothetical protein MSAN_02301900 [Mycena sanguinolenta]
MKIATSLLPAALTQSTFISITIRTACIRPLGPAALLAIDGRDGDAQTLIPITIHTACILPLGPAALLAIDEREAEIGEADVHVEGGRVSAMKAGRAGLASELWLMASDVGEEAGDGEHDKGERTRTLSSDILRMSTRCRLNEELDREAPGDDTGLAEEMKAAGHDSTLRKSRCLREARPSFCKPCDVSDSPYVRRLPRLRVLKALDFAYDLTFVRAAIQVPHKHAALIFHIFRVYVVVAFGVGLDSDISSTYRSYSLRRRPGFCPPPYRIRHSCILVRFAVFAGFVVAERSSPHDYTTRQKITLAVLRTHLDRSTSLSDDHAPHYGWRRK